MTVEKRLKLQVWMLVMVVFGLGAATGFSIHALYGQRQLRLQAQRAAASNSPLLERMRLELDLSDQQDEQLRVILQGARKEMTQLKVAQCPGLKEIRDRMDTRIRGVLSPEQQARFNDLRARREAERAAEADKSSKD